MCKVSIKEQKLQKKIDTKVQRKSVKYIVVLLFRVLRFYTIGIITCLLFCFSEKKTNASNKSDCLFSDTVQELTFSNIKTKY